MEYASHIEAAEQAIAGIGRALAGSARDARVPTCPDWSLGDLADHLDGFCAFWTYILREGTRPPDTPAAQRPAGSDERVDFARAADALLAELRAVQPDKPVWTWVPDEQSAAFVARRAAHELSIHRVDAQLATGSDVDPIDGPTAVDGIEEIFVMIAAWSAHYPEQTDRGSHSGAGETLHLHATDREAEWIIEMSPDGLQVRREHAKGDLALRGAVSDLELMLYQRPPAGEVQTFGDEAVLDSWYRCFSFG